MNAPAIAILGFQGDKQSEAFAQAVRDQGGLPRILDIRQGRGAAEQVSLGQDLARWQQVDCRPISAFYLRALAPNTWPALPPVLNPTSFAEYRTGYFREQEYQAVTYSFFDLLALQGRLVVNPPRKYLHHNSKAQFYELLRAAGFAVPWTVSTNIPERFRQFVTRHGKVVVKPSIGVGSTRLVHDYQLERTQEIALCPVMAQEFIQGHTMRVHVVGETVVLALKILSDQIDSRTAPQGFEFAELPAQARADVAGATRHLGLHFAAWDILLTPDGRACLLDCNPGPYLMWIGEAYVQAVFGQLAALLIGFAQTGDLAQARQRVQSVKS